MYIYIYIYIYIHIYIGPHLCLFGSRVELAALVVVVAPLGDRLLARLDVFEHLDGGVTEHEKQSRESACKNQRKHVLKVLCNY